MLLGIGGEEVRCEGCDGGLLSPFMVVVAGVPKRLDAPSSEVWEARGGRVDVSSLESTSSTLISVSVSESSGPRRGCRRRGWC